MKDYKFKLNGIQSEAHQPKELESLEIKATFDNLSFQPNITATEITFINESAKLINDYIDNGLNTNGVGIFEGIPYEISLIGDTGQYEAFKGYIDLLGIKRNCDEVSVKLVSENDLNKFSERSQALTFGYLESLGLFPKSVLTPVPYCVNYIPDGMQLIVISISLYLITKELVETVPKIPEHTTAVILAATPSIPIPSINVGNLIIQSIKLALLLVYAVMICLAIIKLIDSLFSELYSVKRWFRACKVEKLLSVACNHLGYTFSSSIFLTEPFKDLVFLPQKTAKGTITENDSHQSLFSHTIIDDTGVPNSLSSGYTLYEILELCMNMFNAKILIKDSTVYLEPKTNKTFWELQSSYVLPNIEVLQREYNTNELNPNYIIKFATDVQDLNTIDNFTGTNYERITSPIKTNNSKYLNFGGLTEIDLKVGLGTRKETINPIEALLSGLATIVDKTIGILGLNSNYINSFIDRKGILQVSEHFGWKPKVLLIKDKKLYPTNRTYLSAKYLYNTYHYINSFVANDWGGQYEMYKDIIIPFCFHDFLKVINCGTFVTDKGEKGMFDELLWTFTEDYAKVSYRIQKPYTKNLKEIFIEP